VRKVQASRHIQTQGAVYGPATLKVISQAFDSAWAQIEKRREVQLQADAFRSLLAEAILAEAQARAFDAEALKKAALVRLSLS
jgi:hypothetical protein